MEDDRSMLSKTADKRSETAGSVFRYDSIELTSKNKHNMDMMFLKRLFHLQSELTKMAVEKQVSFYA